MCVRLTPDEGIDSLVQQIEEFKTPLDVPPHCQKLSSQLELSNCTSVCDNVEHRQPSALMSFFAFHDLAEDSGKRRCMPNQTTAAAVHTEGESLAAEQMRAAFRGRDWSLHCQDFCELDVRYEKKGGVRGPLSLLRSGRPPWTRDAPTRVPGGSVGYRNRLARLTLCVVQVPRGPALHRVLRPDNDGATLRLRRPLERALHASG
ncbi:hypothetical protein MTO96_004950 [Rhipicephalus appendiculatus]